MVASIDAARKFYKVSQMFHNVDQLNLFVLPPLDARLRRLSPNILSGLIRITEHAHSKPHEAPEAALKEKWDVFQAQNNTHFSSFSYDKDRFLTIIDFVIHYWSAVPQYIPPRMSDCA